MTTEQMLNTAGSLTTNEETLIFTAKAHGIEAHFHNQPKRWEIRSGTCFTSIAPRRLETLNAKQINTFVYTFKLEARS